MFQWFLPADKSVKMFGWYHLLWIGITIALVVAVVLIKNKKDDKFYRIIMLSVGGYLLLFEIFKQAYLLTNAGGYDWWHAPVQPCSIMMYAIILVGLLKPNKFREYLEAFIVFFGFFYGISAILVPVAIFSTSSYLMLWQSPQHHALLFATALYLVLNKRVALKITTWLKAVAVFVTVCLAGLVFSLFTHLFGFECEFSHSFLFI